MLKILEKNFEEKNIQKAIKELNEYLQEKRYSLIHIYEQGYMQDNKIWLRVTLTLDDEALFPEDVYMPTFNRKELIVKRDEIKQRSEEISQFINQHENIMVGNIGFIDRSKYRNNNKEVMYNKYVVYYMEDENQENDSQQSQDEEQEK